MLNILQSQQNTQLQCVIHNGKPITQMCIELLCGSQTFHCSECIKNNAHNPQLHQLHDVQSGVEMFVNKIQEVAPNSIFARFYEYFRELETKENTYFDVFNSFIRTQKQKISEEIDKIKEQLNSRLDQLKQEILDKMEEQNLVYRTNYDIMKGMFNDPVGQRYKQLIKYSNQRLLWKKLGQTIESDKAQELIRSLKKDIIYFQNNQINEEYESFSNKVQELYLLLNSQSVSPPTFQNNQFETQSVAQIKSYFDALANKIGLIFKQNINHFPIKNFEQIVQEEQFLLKSVRPNISPQQPLIYQGKQNIIVPNGQIGIERGDLKYLQIQEEGVCVTSLTIINEHLLMYALTDSTVRFKWLLDDLQANDFDFVQMKTWIFTIQQLNISFEEEKFQEEPNRLRKRSTNPSHPKQINLEDYKKEQYQLALGGEESIIIWRISLYSDMNSSVKSIEINQQSEYKAQSLSRCTSIMDFQDNKHFLASDWEVCYKSYLYIK